MKTVRNLGVAVLTAAGLAAAPLAFAHGGDRSCAGENRAERHAEKHARMGQQHEHRGEHRHGRFAERQEKKDEQKQ